MTLAVDASFIVAWLVDGGPDGAWADEVLEAHHVVVAPHLMPVEVTNILRRAVLHEDISTDAASMALHDLFDLRVELYAFQPFADRVWELRHNIPAYDAWYVAVAESVDAQLATLDIKLSRASGPRCDFETPPRPLQQ